MPKTKNKLWYIMIYLENGNFRIGTYNTRKQVTSEMNRLILKKGSTPLVILGLFGPTVSHQEFLRFGSIHEMFVSMHFEDPIQRTLAMQEMAKGIGRKNSVQRS